MLSRDRRRRLAAALAPPLLRGGGALVLHLADDERNLPRLLVAPELHGHLAARLACAHDSRQVLGRSNRLAVEAQDHVARLYARLLRRPALLHRVDQRTLELGQPERL